MTRHGVFVRCASCGREFDPGVLFGCPKCGGTLVVRYEDEGRRRETLARFVREGHSGARIDWDPLLPFTLPRSLEDMIQGPTPLVRSRSLGAMLGLSNLYFKLENCNPSGSFKDREILCMLSHAIRDGYKRGVVASSGNAAASAACLCAVAGMPCVLLYERGHVRTKILQAMLYGAPGISVDGLFSAGESALCTLMREICETTQAYPFFCYAPVNPWSPEGTKLIAFETVAQIGRAPDAVLSPVGGGDCVHGQFLGYKELVDAGLIDRMPRLIGVQAIGAAPLVKSWKEGLNYVEPIETSHTVASGICTTFTGNHALTALKRSRGTAIAVSDAEIVEAEARLARFEGIWVEPTSSTVIAALPHLVEEGVVSSQDTVVCVLTGHGYKDIDVLPNIIRQGPTATFSVSSIIDAIAVSHAFGG